MLCSLIRSRHLIRLYLLQRGIQGEGAGDSSQIPYPHSKYTKCGGLVNAASTETIVAACRSRRFLFTPNFPCLSTACGYTPSCGHSVLFLQLAAHDVFILHPSKYYAKSQGSIPCCYQPNSWRPSHVPIKTRGSTGLANLV